MYTDYAPIYDAIGQGAFGAELARTTLASLPQPPAHVLDLACGTGAAALVFAAAGSRVVAVDQSAAMLAIARHKAQTQSLPVTFLQADIRDLNASHVASAFSLQPSTFSLITCFYDSLNYLLNDDDLERVFRGVAGLLAPGGRFIFDLNTEAEYRTWPMSDQVVYDGRDYLVYNRLDYNPKTRRASGRIVWFVREIERWWRGEEMHLQRPWREAEIAHAAAAAGLRVVARRTPQHAPADDTARRVVYELTLA
jgi:SAM-dependent methyltransferase